MPGAAAAPAKAGKAIVNVFDGLRQPYSDSPKLLIMVRDGKQNVVSRKFHATPSVQFTGLKISDNLTDDYTFLVSAKHYKDAGYFPVRIAAGVLSVVDLLLIPNESTFTFERWETVSTRYSKIATALTDASTVEQAAARYNDAKEISGGAVLACLLNIAAAMKQILLPHLTALEYVKAFEWKRQGSHAMAQDRVFAWADPALIQQIEQAKVARRFVDAPSTLHPGATRSYKQCDFGEANLQITFHENDRHEIGGTNCVLLEADIDYFHDPLAHLLLEVAVNAFGDMTDPRTVYALRWVAGRRAGFPEFEPPYSIQRA